MFKISLYHFNINRTNLLKLKKRYVRLCSQFSRQVSSVISSVLTVLMDVRGRVMPVITAAQELIFRTVAGGADCQLLRAEWEEDADMF